MEGNRQWTRGQQLNVLLWRRSCLLLIVVVVVVLYWSVFRFFDEAFPRGWMYRMVAFSPPQFPNSSPRKGSIGNLWRGKQLLGKDLGTMRTADHIIPAILSKEKEPRGSHDDPDAHDFLFHDEDKLRAVESPFVGSLYAPLITSYRDDLVTELQQQQQQQHDHDSIAGQPVVRRLWTYWAQGLEQAPLLVQACVHKMRRLHQRYWDVAVVSKDSLSEYLTDEEVVLVLGAENSWAGEPSAPEKNGGKKDWQFSADLLRLLLLRRHGGVWVDATSILSQDLEWVIEKKLIEINATDAHSGIVARRAPAEVFAFHYNERYHSPDFSDLNPSRAPVLENWFIAARAGKTRFVTEWLLRFLGVLLRKKPHSFVEDFRERKFSTGTFYEKYLQVYLRQHLAAFYVLQKKHEELCGGLPAGGEGVLRDDPAGVRDTQECAEETASLLFYRLRTEAATVGPFWPPNALGFDWSTDASMNNKAYFRKIAMTPWPWPRTLPKYLVKIIGLWAKEFPERGVPLSTVVRFDSLVGRLFSRTEMEMGGEV